MIPKFPTRLAALFIACAGSFATHAQTTTTAPERKVVVFGDGYSDAGNSDRRTNPGGFVWIEQLLGAVADPNFDPGVTGNGLVSAISVMDLMYNPAAGTPGATSLNAAYTHANAWRQGQDRIQSPTGQTIRNNVGGHIRAYLMANEKLASEHMVFYMAGANDLMTQVYDLQTLPTGQNYLREPVDSAQLVATEALAAITTLGEPYTGAQSGGLGATHVVVLNLPNLAGTPRYGPLPLPEVMQTATRAFNAALAVRLVGLTNADPDTTYILVDVETAFDAVFSQGFQTPGSTAFTEFTASCQSRPDGCFAKFSDTKGYFFYDDIHPGNGGHTIIANAVRDALLSAGPSTQALARSLGLIN